MWYNIPRTRDGIKGSWFVNLKSISWWSHNQKFVKLPFFMNLFSQNVTINNHRRRYLSVYQSRVTRFFVINTFISNTTLKWQNINRKLSSTLRLRFCYLKISFLYPRYHPKTIGDNIENVQKTSASVLMRSHN